ncbi:hypothetical protein N7462_007216 [Penicillium macrosclerotiorum]|uniref:uncharacterized protein n=1 Tax=Penicillium macrosclerotiorum TaxID=303699 RepID=UPI0025495E60|nr:uncharacterized protein N7462_007216 [Penicillium macrosclerotiorum]KAJ5678972.1 hypothetical protein N7462_007216 [Penicillium macrosclerotiorum]
MGARSRLGCLSCRRRKKKCDEVKPICTACLRNALACTWPDSDSNTQCVSVIEVRSAQRLQTFDTRDTPASDAWALTTGSPCEYVAATIPAAPSYFVLPGSVSPGSETWRLLDHYLKDTANRLACLQDGENPFLHTILPAALDDELLMNSILALSGVHMMQRLPHLNVEMQLLTWSSYSRALKQLRVSLSKPFDGTNSVDAVWRALLVVLIFYLLEATRGNDPQAMQRHLEGAHHLMAHALQATTSPAQPSIVSFATELYVYNAALASFSTNCPPTLSMLSSAFLNSPKYPNPEIGVLCGCAYELFALVPKVSALLWEMNPHRSSQLPYNPELIVSYYNTRAQVENWKPRSDKSELVLCAELYQQSLLLLLDVHFPSEFTTNIIDQAFQKFESLLSHLPPESPIATTTTWPLFAFGMHARVIHQKEIVRQYLTSVITIFRMGVMSTALTQLEEIWTEEFNLNLVRKFFANHDQLLLIC